MIHTHVSELRAFGGAKPPGFAHLLDREWCRACGGGRRAAAAGERCLLLVESEREGGRRRGRRKGRKQGGGEEGQERRKRERRSDEGRLDALRLPSETTLTDVTNHARVVHVQLPRCGSAPHASSRNRAYSPAASGGVHACLQVVRHADASAHGGLSVFGAVCRRSATPRSNPGAPPLSLSNAPPRPWPHQLPRRRWTGSLFRRRCRCRLPALPR